jgi:hypothetical protein
LCRNEARLEHVVTTIDDQRFWPRISSWGRTALELHGYVHYLKSAATDVYLYGPKPPPTWLAHLDTGVRFLYRNDGKLFRKLQASTAPHRLDRTSPLEKGAAGRCGGNAVGPVELAADGFVPGAPRSRVPERAARA